MLGLNLSVEAVAARGLGGGGANPYSGYALALDFINANYTVNGTRYASLPLVPGYAFTDNVDNQPNITGSGFSAVAAELSTLRVTPPITSESDFIFYTTATIGAAPAANGALAYIGVPADHADRVYFYVAAANTWASAYISAASVGADHAGTSMGTGNVVFGVRRKAQKWTAFQKAANGTSTIHAEDGATTAFPAVTTMAIGYYPPSGAGADGMNKPIRGVFMQSGTFADADIIALLGQL